MISRSDFIVIHDLYNKGYSIRKIARELKLDRKTVTRKLREAEYKANITRVAPLSKLEPYKAYIRDFISKGNKRIPYSVILEDLIELGYTGKRAILQEFLTKEYKELNKQKSSNDPVVRFETEPGEQMQVDWTKQYAQANVPFMPTWQH